MVRLVSIEWISEDLLRKIDANPKLRKGLTDPRFAEMLNKFNANPSEAMKEFSGDAEAMSFFQQYCSLLGQHFTDLGSKEDARREEERQRIMKMPKAERKAKLRELKGAPCFSAIYRLAFALTCCSFSVYYHYTCYSHIVLRGHSLVSCVANSFHKLYIHNHYQRSYILDNANLSTSELTHVQFKVLTVFLCSCILVYITLGRKYVYKRSSNNIIKVSSDKDFVDCISLA